MGVLKRKLDDLFGKRVNRTGIPLKNALPTPRFFSGGIVAGQEGAASFNPRRVTELLVYQISLNQSTEMCIPQRSLPIL